MSKASNDDTTDQHCEICTEPYLNPVLLECNHVFCYLCVKGHIENNGHTCPYCRKSISHDFLDKPKLVSKLDDVTVSTCWYYQGRNGWWKYDPRNNDEIENAYQVYVSDHAKREYVMQVAGHTYTIDFKNLMQTRTDNKKLKRKIKRDLNTSENTKGIAGIKIEVDKAKNDTSENDDDLIKKLDKISISKK